MSLSVPIDTVRADPQQPRKYFRESALKALATSIKKTGQRQPITVRQRSVGSKPLYEIIDGERRWRACKLAGIASVRIDIEERELSQHAAQHLLSLTSNFMREGHTHIEISQAVAYQVEASIEGGMTRGQAVLELVDSIGKSDAWIYQYLQLQHLSGELQDLMHPDVPEEMRLRFAEAVVLSTVPADSQKSIYNALLRYPAGVRAQKAKALVAEATGVPIQRRSKHIKRSTGRFVFRISAEIERVLDYKQSEFRAAFAEVPAHDRDAFRASLVMLLTEIDTAMGKAVGRG